MIVRNGKISITILKSIVAYNLQGRKGNNTSIIKSEK